MLMTSLKSCPMCTSTPTSSIWPERCGHPPCNAHLVVTVVQWLEEVAAIHTDDDGVHALEAIGNKV